MLRVHADGGHAAKLEPGFATLEPFWVSLSCTTCRGVRCDQSHYYYLRLRWAVVW